MNVILRPYVARPLEVLAGQLPDGQWLVYGQDDLRVVPDDVFQRTFILAPAAKAPAPGTPPRAAARTQGKARKGKRVAPASRPAPAGARPERETVIKQMRNGMTLDEARRQYPHIKYSVLWNWAQHAKATP